MIEIPLRRGSPSPLYQQLSAHLERMIRGGALTPGERLPGSRSFAQSLGVSRMTVMEAYRHLEERSLVVQRGRSGAFVAGSLSPEDQGMKMSGCHWSMDGECPSKSLVPALELARLAKDALATRGVDVLRDVSLAGLDDLRHSLVFHSASRGIPGEWRDVVVTSGARHGLVVSFAFLRSIGISSILMDRLNYPDSWRLAQAEGLTVVPFSDHEELMSLMDVACWKTAVYLVPSFANPTGATISLENRQAILDMSHVRGLWIVEDDAYGELRYGQDSVPAMRAMDDGDRLIYLGSFSQALFPGMRLGYSMIPDGAMDLFLSALSLRGGPASSLVQCVLDRFISSGGLEMALDRVRMEISFRMKKLSCELGQIPLPWVHNMPQGGIYLWLSTPGLDGQEASRLARLSGVSVSPGVVFSLEKRPLEAVRLSVSDVSLSSISSAVRALSVAWGGYLSSSSGRK
ncbi:MAG: PLP-dependent aminotransferase family protein [Synergistales bacterium]|nr:PLP-dependent aminotransferase family protein [Dethiosulfovibrio sp.]NCC96481.1 PLP-dependent aminotransferase family protein [Synergistales bacterium]